MNQTHRQTTNTPPVGPANIPDNETSTTRAPAHASDTPQSSLEPQPGSPTGVVNQPNLLAASMAQMGVLESDEQSKTATDSQSNPEQQDLTPSARSLEDTPPTASEPGPSRLRTDAFTSYRDHQSTDRNLGPSSGSAWDAPLPHKRPRAADPETILHGIQPHPARSPRWELTPATYTNDFAHLHPWARHVNPRPNFTDLSADLVTAEAPTHVYRQIPSQGYFASRFVRSLFPRRFVGPPSPNNKVPILEISRLQDIVAFRQHAIQLTSELLDHRFRDDSGDVQNLPVTPAGPQPSAIYPPSREGNRPVLYQVVNRNYGQGVILEAKDFFVPGPDHRELHCIPMTQESVNHLTGTRGFDKSQIAVKDFVWVYSLRPTTKTLNTWDRKTILHRAQIPRPSVIDSGHPYFLRVHEFILVTPPRARRNMLGFVLAVARRGPEGVVNHIQVALEGCREAVRLTQSICQFPLDQVEREDLLFAEVRPNVSCSMRFSHSPISLAAQRFLTNAVRHFIPAYPEEAALPLRVSRMTAEDRTWVADRITGFANYSLQRTVARTRMGKLFAVASAALAAQATMSDDRHTHHVTATIPTLDSIPLRLQFELSAMSTDGGWTRGRSVDIWIFDSSCIMRTRIARTRFSIATQTIQLELHSEARTHNNLRSMVRRYGSFDQEQNNYTLRISICLGRIPSGTDPVFEFLACDNLSTLLRPTASTIANTVMDTVYASQLRANPAGSPGSQPTPLSFTARVRSRTLTFRGDQARAVLMGTQDHPVLAIQAAYGTGKTVVGALIASRLAAAGHFVIVTATTNVAVGQFTDTLLTIEPEQQRSPTILRFVADTALQEGAPTTPVDLHHILKDLLVTHTDSLTPNEQEKLARYAHGRRLLERVLFNPASTLNMTDEEREEFRIAEYNNSIATERAVAVMLRVRFPNIVALTVSSLLNTTKPGGLFHEAFCNCSTIIGDEASQIPEPAFIAMAAHFPQARHIYIGDVYQLEPHIRCPRSSLAAQLGSKGVMSLLFHREVPLAPLATTYRAHPALNNLPNILVYNGALVNGTPANQRTLLTSRLTLPNPSLPLVVVNVEGSSQMSHTQSHSNEEEAAACMEIIRALIDKDIQPSSIGIITFYKDQQRLLEERASRFDVRLHTVDSAQGHEMDVVIILTTRTHIEPSTAEFLDDLKRMNVAITRCRHGQFILGRVDALRHLTNWGRLLEWAAGQNVIISRSSLPDLFI